ncbi:MAG: hypothetical protein ACLQIB_02595 [Isosphaeraceae bacterium]
MPDGWLTSRYNYRVARLWTEDPEPYLSGGIALTTLAPLTNLPEAALPRVLRRMADWINKVAP